MKDKDLNFEKALGDLETTVDQLEKGGLSLNDSLALFEKGVKLARFLRDELDKAEKKVEILLKDEKGGLKAQPFRQEGGEDADAPETEDAEETDDDEDRDDDDEEKPGETSGPKPKGKPRGGKKPEGGDSLPF
jgi:exodeoxyribonuclease VII small subunit